MGSRQKAERGKCQIPGCNNTVRVIERGWCNAHYEKWRRHGHPYAGKTTYLRREPYQFIENVALAYKGDDCLNWPYYRGTFGYGHLFDSTTKKQVGVHRIVCLRAHGEPPPGRNVAAHSCGNASCCNPRHIRWATQQENMADCIKHGTRLRGERQHQAKLTQREVMIIRSRRGRESQRAIAKEFGICQQTVSDIQCRKRWSWLGGSA